MGRSPPCLAPRLSDQQPGSLAVCPTYQTSSTSIETWTSCPLTDRLTFSASSTAPCTNQRPAPTLRAYMEPGLRLTLYIASPVPNRENTVTSPALAASAE